MEGCSRKARSQWRGVIKVDCTDREGDDGTGDEELCGLEIGRDCDQLIRITVMYLVVAVVHGGWIA